MSNQLRMKAVQPLQRVGMIDIEVADGQGGSTMATKISKGKNQIHTIQGKQQSEKAKTIVEVNRFMLIIGPCMQVSRHQRSSGVKLRQ